MSDPSDVAPPRPVMSHRQPGAAGEDVTGAGEAAALRRRLMAGTAATAAGNAWAMAVGLVMLPVLLATLGVAGLGWWALLQTLTATSGWCSLADLGMRVPVIRTTAAQVARGERREAAATAASALTLYGVVAVLAGALLAVGLRPAVGGVWSVPARWEAPLRAAVLALAVQVAAELVAAGAQAVLEGWQRVALARGLDALRRTLAAVGTCALALSTHRLDAAVAGAALGTAIAAVATVVAVARVVGRAAAPDPRAMRALAGYGTTVGAINATGVAHRTMDRWIAAIALGAPAVALVEVVTQIANASLAVLSSSAYATTSAAPWIAARTDAGANVGANVAANAGNEPLTGFLVRTTRWCMLATLPVAALTAVLAEPLTAVWTPWLRPSVVASVALAVLAVALSAPLQVGSLMLQSLGEAAAVLRAAVAALVANLLTSVLLVHWWGVPGVFAGTVVGAVVLAVPLTRATCRSSGVVWTQLAREAWLPALAPAGAAAAAAMVVASAPLGPVATLVGAGAAGVVAAGLVMARDPRVRADVTELGAAVRGRR